MSIRRLFTRYLFTALTLSIFGMIAWSMADRTGILGSKPERLERKLEAIIREYSPGPEQANTWVVLYWYKSNHTVRCRTNVAIYPSGVEPLPSGCDTTNQEYRKLILMNHLQHRGAVLEKGDAVVTGDLEYTWERYGLTSIANYPIYHQDRLLGYINLSFTGNTMRVPLSGGIGSENVESRVTKELLAKPLAAAIAAHYRLNPKDIDVNLY